MAIDNQPTGTRENAATRRVQALELRKQGQSYRAIGAALGVSEAQAHNDIKASLAEVAKLEQASAEELRTMELLRLDLLAVAAARVLSATHPLVSGGKVLSGFDADGKPIGLTDDAPRLAAIDRLLRISESRRKLLGIDAPAKTALTNPDGTPAAYAELRAVVLNLLAPYPDLRLALADQLAQLPEEAPDGEQSDI